jgi:hypothetical protein
MSESSMPPHKAAQLRQIITDWVLGNKVLQPGQQLVCTFRIEDTPCVILEETNIAATDKPRAAGLISPREVYDAAVKMKREIGRATMNGVARMLNAKPELIGRFAMVHEPRRVAFDAAKRGQPYPAQLINEN